MFKFSRRSYTYRAWWGCAKKTYLRAIKWAHSVRAFWHVIASERLSRLRMQIDLRSDYERQHDVPLRNGLLTQSILVKGTRSRSDVNMQVRLHGYRLLYNALCPLFGFRKWFSWGPVPVCLCTLLWCRNPRFTQILPHLQNGLYRMTSLTCSCLFKCHQTFIWAL